MKQCIDKMLVILPFEKDYFKNNWNWEVEYVGHPLVEVVNGQLSMVNGPSLSDRFIIALLPGSRNGEVSRLAVSPNTVKTHVTKLFAKLEASRRTEAIRRARELGMLP